MAIQVRRGNEVDFDASKMLPGEWAVSLDTKYIRMCFAPGVCLRMATYEGFEADMAKIEAILAEVQSVEEAVERIQAEINATAVEVDNYARSAEASALEAKEYAEAAAESAEKAESITGPVVSGIKGSAESDYRTGNVTIKPEDLGLENVVANMLKAETLTLTTNFNIVADTQPDFFVALGKAVMDRGVALNETVHVRGTWASRFYFTAFCTYMAGNVLEMLYFDNGSNVWIVRYNTSNSTLGSYYKIASTVDLAKYLPLTGGSVDGNIVPKTDSTKLLGVDTLAWLALYANQYGLTKGGKGYGNFQVGTQGTPSTQGYALLRLGNNIPTGEEGNSTGYLWLHGKGTGSVQLHPHGVMPDGAVRQVYLPNENGTLALLSDVQALNTLTQAEQAAVTYFIESVFSVMSTTNNISHAFFTKDRASYAWHGMYQQSNYASFILHGYNIRTIHMQLNNGVWTYNVMDNK